MTLCCTPNLKVLAPATCDTQLCKSDYNFRCGSDPEADFSEDTEACDPLTEFCSDSDAISRRKDVISFLPTSHSEERSLEKRGRRKFNLKLETVLGVKILIQLICRSYPGSTKLHQGPNGHMVSIRAYR